MLIDLLEVYFLSQGSDILFLRKILIFFIQTNLTNNFRFNFSVFLSVVACKEPNLEFKPGFDDVKEY